MILFTAQAGSTTIHGACQVGALAHARDRLLYRYKARMMHLHGIVPKDMQTHTYTCIHTYLCMYMYVYTCVYCIYVYTRTYLHPMHQFPLFAHRDATHPSSDQHQADKLAFW